MEETIVEHPRCDYPGDPNRCQAVFKNGGAQCSYLTVPGSKYCRLHNGHVDVAVQAAQSLRFYRAAQWSKQIGEFADHPNLKSLREEIGILRVIISEKLNICRTPTDLLMRSASISDMIVKVEKLVSSCHKIEQNLGGLLDKAQAQQLGQEIIQIVGKYLTDPDQLRQFAEELTSTVDRSSGIGLR